MATTTRAQGAPATTRQRWLYLDGPLIAFVTVMVAAAAITSHGTYVFYSYILSSFLAYSATIVLTAGIPLLELAAVLDRANRARYIAGMLVLLAMEGAAQYFQGQAIFVKAVKAQFPDAVGVDLATFAAQPWGRVLPLLYLAALSGIVVYFGYAASARIRDLRAGVVVAGDYADQVAQLKSAVQQAQQGQAEAVAALKRNESDAVAQLRAELADALRSKDEMIASIAAQHGAEVAQVAVERDTLAAKLTQTTSSEATLARQLAHQEQQARHIVAQLEEQVNQRDTHIRDLVEQVAQAAAQRAEDGTLTVGGKLAVSWRQLEAATGVAQSTLRRKLGQSEPVAA